MKQTEMLKVGTKHYKTDWNIEGGSRSTSKHTETDWKVQVQYNYVRPNGKEKTMKKNVKYHSEQTKIIIKRRISAIYILGILCKNKTKTIYILGILCKN